LSLRRRITLATTVAVALVALLVGAIGYLSTRSHLIDSTQDQLKQRAQQYLVIRDHDHGHGFGIFGRGQPGNGTPGTGQSEPGGSSGRRGTTGKAAKFGIPKGPAFGGAPGQFQAVSPNGKITPTARDSSKLPIDAEVLKIARIGRGSFFRDAEVPQSAGGQRVHVELYTFADPSTHTAIEVSLPLTIDDQVLSRLLLTYALLVGGGILLAGLIGAYVARTALRPIDRFTDRTEVVTGVLDEDYTGALQAPPRLEEANASELKRLARSFNQTLDALERAIQAQRHLIADASHELRTPMAALRSNVQIFMEADRLPPAERVELQDAIIAELDELTQLVADVLDLARGSAPSDHVEPVELDTLVREAIARARRRAPEVTFNADLEPTVIINAPERVGRAITNVIDNARKWSPSDGAVEVALRDGLLTVRDHGPGFKESDLSHVFDRFYRADEARRLPGSGLGLAIVRQAAQAYGGHATASNAPDGGAVIEVAFGSHES
jgi:two-component system, OmpR family, sensor histidine kinase MprB